MAAVEMVYGWISDGRSAWDAPMGMWAWLFGLEHFGRPENHVASIVFGMAGHMANSAVVGVLVAVIVAGLGASRLAGALVLGVLYALAVWALMRYGVLPLKKPEARLFTTDTISPESVWWVAHAAYGLTAALLVYAAGRLRGARVNADRGLPRAA